MLNYNGSLFDDKATLLATDNRSFRYGDGLFESIRVINGEMPLFDWHISRLFRGMKALKISQPSYFTKSFLRHEILKTVDKMPAARVRLSVFRESGGLYTPVSMQPDYLIEASLLTDKTYKLNDIGVRLGQFDAYRLHATPHSAYKTSNALPYVMAAIYARENAFDDVLMLDTEGYVAEGIASNLFVYHNHQWHTPPLSTGCVGGVLRQYLLDTPRSAAFKCQETRFRPDWLHQATALMLVNAVQGIRWVEQYEATTYDLAPVSAFYEAFRQAIGAK